MTDSKNPCGSSLMTVAQFTRSQKMYSISNPRRPRRRNCVESSQTDRSRSCEFILSAGDDLFM